MHNTNATREISDQDRIFNFVLKIPPEEGLITLLSVMLNFFPFSYLLMWSILLYSGDLCRVYWDYLKPSNFVPFFLHIPWEPLAPTYFLSVSCTDHTSQLQPQKPGVSLDLVPDRVFFLICSRTQAVSCWLLAFFSCQHVCFEVYQILLLSLVYLGQIVNAVDPSVLPTRLWFCDKNYYLVSFIVLAWAWHGGSGCSIKFSKEWRKEGR